MKTKISNDREHAQVLFGDLCVDAALCCSKTQDIIAKVQAKYPLNTLVDMLTDADCEDPHFKEVLLGLLRSAYIDPYRAKDQYDLLHKDFCAKIVHILNTWFEGWEGNYTLDSLQCIYLVFKVFYSVIQNQIFEEELDDLRKNFALEKKIEVVLQKLIGEFKFFAKPKCCGFHEIFDERKQRRTYIL